MRMTAAMADAAVYIAMVGGRRDGRVAPEQPPRQPCIINVGGIWTDGRHLCRLKAEQSPAPGSRAGGADCFGRKARAGEEMTLLGEDDNGDPPGP